jgi:hypothetical protein
LEREQVDGDRVYHLTQHSDLRKLALKFARQLNGS